MNDGLKKSISSRSSLGEPQAQDNMIPNPNQNKRGMLASPNPWIKKDFIRLAQFVKQAITKLDKFHIVLDSADIEDNKYKLEKALVGHTLGKRLPYRFLNIDLRCKWS